MSGKEGREEQQAQRSLLITIYSMFGVISGEGGTGRNFDPVSVSLCSGLRHTTRKVRHPLHSVSRHRHILDGKHGVTLSRAVFHLQEWYPAVDVIPAWILGEGWPEVRPERLVGTRL